MESLKAHFGVTVPDFRLQRSEYLGGATTMLNQMPIAQTSGTTTATGWTTPQGTLTSMATFSHVGAGFNHSFVEHGVVIGLLSIRADLAYQQGLERSWSRQTRLDHYWPALSHLNEQAVLKQELLFTGNPANDGAVFGYQERYAEYRYKPSSITGLFRSTATASLDFWHLAQEFDPGDIATIEIGRSFLEENPPIDRVIAVQDEPQFLVDCLFDLQCARPMPVYSVPGLLDHF